MLMVNHLAGFGGGADVLALALAGSGTSTATDGAITSSVTIQAGDLLAIFGRGAGLSGAAFPPDFTQVAVSTDTANAKCGILYKIATGAEGTSVTGFSGAGTAALGQNCLYVFRGGKPITAVVPGGAGAELTAGDPASQVVPSGSGTPALVVLGGYNAVGAAVDPRTMSPAKDGEINATTNTYLAYKLYNTDPVDVTVDMDDEGGANNLCSCYLACS